MSVIVHVKIAQACSWRVFFRIIIVGYDSTNIRFLCHVQMRARIHANQNTTFHMDDESVNTGTKLSFKNT